MYTIKAIIMSTTHLLKPYYSNHSISIKYHAKRYDHSYHQATLSQWFPCTPFSHLMKHMGDISQAKILISYI